MDDGVYICTWSRSNDGFSLWVKSRPRIRASGPTYAEAEERLIEAIQQAGGAMHAVLEFDPPLPRSTLDEKYGSPELHLIGGDDRFETDAPRWSWTDTTKETEDYLRWLDGFYDKPFCRKCKQSPGRRNGKPLTIAYSPGQGDGAFGSPGRHGTPNQQIVSEEFLDLLTEDEKHRLEFQPVIRKGRRKFFELVGPEGPPHVAVAGMKISGWRCTQCDYRTWSYSVEGMAITHFVAQSDLPDRIHGVFTVGIFPEIELAVTGPRWKEMLGRKGTRGFVSQLLGVAPDHEVVRRPTLPEIKKPTKPAWW
ncbi:MAG TPA: hypothetical protein VJ783_25435 [Pirellulales bacterium]|nr:hypothetical protein [Pirellulales bacterium]